MRLLLDTHILLWWIADDPSLRADVREAIADERATVAVSAATAWEIAIKKSLGKLEAPDDLESQLARHRFMPLSVNVAHAMAAGALPRHHEDPFDRMIVAQAQIEGFTIVTRDRRMSFYQIHTMAA
jgi:PIN domain nuclease of toxin-antitoxin system